MPLSIISTPEVDVNSNTNTVGKYFSTNRPIKFGIQRDADFAFSAINCNSTTVATVTATGFGAMWYETVTAGTDFEIEITGSDFPDGIVTVTSDILIGSNSFTIDITGMGYTAANSFTGGDLKIVRTNYRVKTRISVAGSVVGTAVNKLDTSYQTITDVSAFLKGSISYNEDYDFTTLNLKDENKSNVFTLEFSESWSGYELAYDAEGTGNYYFMNSVRQLGDLYNGNMGDYTIFSNYDIADPRALFLSDFEKPTYFDGYPFSLDFIFNADFATGSFSIKKIEEPFNLNNVSAGSSNYTLSNTGKNYINRMKLEGSYASTVDYLEVWLEKVSVG